MKPRSNVYDIDAYRRDRRIDRVAQSAIDHLALHYLILMAWVAGNVAFLKWLLRK